MKLLSLICAVCLGASCASAQQTEWSIESVGDGSASVTYLKGQQEADSGINKFMIACSAPMLLYAIYHDVRNTEDVMKWPVNWLLLDGRRIRIDKQLYKKESNHGEIFLSYNLNSDLLTAIAKAKRVGVGLQPATGSAAFSGFKSMPFEVGAAKLADFLSVCNSSASPPNNASPSNPKSTWVAVLVVYVAPSSDAVNWEGPWTPGNVIAGQNFFSSEAECRADTEARIKAIHEQMRAPILYRCVTFQEKVCPSRCLGARSPAPAPDWVKVSHCAAPECDSPWATLSAKGGTANGCTLSDLTSSSRRACL
jgi:hypothetical protein